MIYEIKLLNDEQIDYISNCYKEKNFVDGSISNPSKIKNNLMMTGHHHTIVSHYFTEILHNNVDMYSIFTAKKVSEIYSLWYKPESFYGYHIDTNPIGGINAHMSMTCFLNDPEEYEGGELVIKIGSEEVTIKKKRGTAILYNTGLWHKVNPVISGDRKVVVCWIESIIKNTFIRNHIIEYGSLLNNLTISDDTITNGYQLLENLEQFRINLMREYGE